MIFTTVENAKAKAEETASFNPLIQVNDFYQELSLYGFYSIVESFNPLIQVNDFYFRRI